MQDEIFDRGVWAVVAAPGYGLLIGSFEPADYPDQDVDNIIQNRQPITLDPCFVFEAKSMMVQTPQGPATTYMRQVMPMANCVGGGKLITVIDSALLFHMMEKGDEERHKGLVLQLLQQLVAARAKATGITLVGAGDMPSGPIPGQS